MVKRPFFSIVIPTYNRASDLHFALFCILRQSFSDFEVIISDNCSTDNTKDLVNTIKDKRIRYVRMNKNVTYSVNLKNAIKYARGKYIFFHSDDDFLLYKDSLEKIYKKVTEHNLGYIRMSYVCLTPDKNGIFVFKPNKRFVKNEYLPAFADNNKVVSFIVDGDHYFITGLVFKNMLPKNIVMVISEHAPWMNMLFYATKNFGAYFVSEPSIVASWSQWRNSQNGQHPVYSLIGGKLESENYFNIIKEKLDRKSFSIFLHNQLISIYVRLFPLIKVKIGNKNLIAFSKRIRNVDPSMNREMKYWIYLSFALFLPRQFLKMLRDFYLFLYIKTSRVENDKNIIHTLKLIEREYQRISGKKEAKFNFF